MDGARGRPSLTTLGLAAALFGLACYFLFAAVQGDYGLFRRLEVEAEQQELEARLAALQAELARMGNLTRRLSDRYLDLDLLDERARRILGLARGDELIVR